MSEYKRLTVRCPDGRVAVKATEYYEKPYDGTTLIYRLAELEDKLEAGTLVELPEPKIDIDFFGGDWYIVYHKVVTKTEGNFNTRDAAEARLKEL